MAVRDNISVAKAADLLGCTVQYVRKLCRAGRLAGAVYTKTDKQWRIPITADVRLLGSKEVSRLDSGELAAIPAAKRDAALGRLGLIREFEKFSSSYIEQGGGRTDALSLFAAEKKTNARSLFRWMQQYRQEGLIGLIDARGGRVSSDQISDDAFETFKAMFLTEQQLSVKLCWQNICYLNKSRKLGWTIPALRSMYRVVREQIPLYVQILHREGLAAYEAKCAPYIQRDPESVEPGAVWVGDHHQFNCWVRHRNKWIRPWITAWLDMRSRSLVGYYITESPNQTTILLAMKRGIEKYGPPDSVKIDNGKDYDSELWTGVTKAKRKQLKKGYIDEHMIAGLYAMMDVGVSFAIPYHPQSKPIERFFDTLDCQFVKTIDTYCGKDSARKPEKLNDLLKSDKAIGAAYDLKSFEAKVGEYLEAYNNTAHTGAGMDGATPAAVLASRESRRVLADGVLDLLMRVWSRELVVGKNGVRFNNMYYGQFDGDLLALYGSKVRVAYDPDDLRKVWVYDAVTLTLVTIAKQNRLIQYGDKVSEVDLREASKQKARAVRVARQYKDSRLVANMDLTDLTIRAMREGREQRDEASPPKRLRPVITPLNDQVDRHEAVEIRKEVRKAAGAEGLGTVLDFDFSKLNKTITKSKYEGMKIFDE